MKDVTAIARKLVASCKLLNLNITGDMCAIVVQQMLTNYSFAIVQKMARNWKTQLKDS